MAIEIKFKGENCIDKNFNSSQRNFNIEDSKIFMTFFYSENVIESIKTV